MKRFHFSVAALMGVVLLLALGMASLRANTAMWASAMFTAAVILFATAIVAALAIRGLGRFTWTGMAVFGWVYLIIAFGPWIGNATGPPPLLPSSLLDYIQDYVLSNGHQPYVYFTESINQINKQMTFSGNLVPGAAPPPGGYKTVDIRSYLQTGHSFGGMLFGIMGALVGRFIAARSGQSETA
jgi:hypothetical protein